jgi:hypothetical protein
MASPTSPAGAKYAFGYGRIGVLQQQLLSPSDIDRLLGAHSDRELRQVLSEIKLTSHVMPLENFDEFVPSMERWLKGEVEKMSPPDKRDVLNILWLREDLPVLAYYLKKYHGQTSPISKDPSASVTMYDIRLVKAQIFEEKNDHQTLPSNLVRFIEGIKARTSISPQEIDSEVAQFVALTQRGIARRSGSRLIKRYASHLIDLQNIRTSRRLNNNQEARLHFVAGGEIDADLLTHDIEKMSVLIRRSSLPDSVLKSIGAGDTSAVVLERGLNRGLAHDIAEMRSIPLSIEPIFAFAVIALSHVLLIRTILIGKAAKLSAQDISTMLPPFFSTSFANA